MTELESSGTRHRLALAGGLLVLLVAASLGILSLVPCLLPPLTGDDPNRLMAVLSQTIETKGIDAAVGRYRTLRARGFPGLQESESDTNRLGYALLQKGQAESAIRVFQLNVETHPDSANVYDSLAEAYLTAGNTPLAIANYEKALAIDPAKKSTVTAARSHRPDTATLLTPGALPYLQRTRRDPVWCGSNGAPQRLEAA